MNQPKQPTSFLAVRVHPRSGKNRHQLAADGSLEIWVAAPAVDGAANKAVIAYLADLLNVPRSRISIARGESSRTKQLEIPLTTGMLRERLGDV